MTESLASRLSQRHLLGTETRSAADARRILVTAEVVFDVSRRPVRHSSASA